MKKSQLRKIIRESIKELIKEQSGNGCDTCDSTQWSNAGSWYSTVFMAKITSLGGYVNGVPVNPAPQACKYICERLGIWNSKCPTVGPVWQNQLACKIESGQYESGAHGCAC